MNSEITKIISEVSKLDSWDILSALGGCNFACRQAAINTTVRMIPNLPPEGSGVEGFTAWEQQMKNPEIKKAVAGMVYLADLFTDTLNEYTDTPPSHFEEVLQFMVSRPPSRDTHVRDYDNRKRLGMRPAMPMSQFVEAEYAQALKRHQDVVAKGEAAVQLLNGIEGADEPVPEWLYEAIHQKVLSKLNDRWNRAEMRRTNPRITKNDRDTAEANQRMIEACIKELGGDVPSFQAELDAQDDVEAYLAKMNAGTKQ